MPTKQPLTVASTFAKGSQPNKEGNFLEQFGVDPRSQQQILQQMSQQRVQDALEANDGRRADFPGDLMLQDSGAAIGAMLANKFNKPQLSPEQQRGQKAKADTDKAIALMESGGAFDNEDGDLDVFKKSDEYQRRLAGNLIKVSDPRGIDMARELQKRMQEQEIYKQERKKAGLDIEGAEISNSRGRTGFERDKLALEKGQYDFKRGKFLAVRGDLKPVYIAGSKSPNSSIMAFIGDDGNANTMDDQQNIYQIPLGAYTTVRPDDPNAAGGGKGAWNPTPTEQSNIRAAQRSIMTQMRLANVMVDALEGSIDESGTLDIMDGAGKFQAFAVNLANNTNAIMRQGEKWIGITDGDPNDPNSKIVGRVDGTIASTLNYVKNNAEYVKQFVPIPDNVKEGSIQAQRYQAAVVQMAYAKARSNEPGARQLSDADFKNAIKQIGAAATDPEALRQILMDNVEGAGQDFDFWRKQVGPNAANIIGPEAMKEYDAARSAFDDKFSRVFGTPEQPTLGQEGDPVALPPGNGKIETQSEQRTRILATGNTR